MTTLFLNYGVNTGLSVNTFRNAGYFNHDVAGLVEDMLDNDDVQGILESIDAAICEYELNN